jgi:hypothetical protein
MGRQPPSSRFQRGYLLEIPILLFVVALVLAVLLPMLSPVGQKILLGLALIPVLFFLYYMIVIPGWTPGDRGRLKPPWNLILFVLTAGVIVFGVAAFVLSSPR